jgi:hypothetical protein
LRTKTVYVNIESRLTHGAIVRKEKRRLEMATTRRTKKAAPAGPKLSITHHGVRYDDPDRETLNRVLDAQNKEIAAENERRGAAPEWLDHTPEAMDEYMLAMWVNSTTEQRIEVTREEFIALKAHLAALRGITVESEAKAA